MSPHQTYFYRNRGPWKWSVHFELTSWAALWSASIPVFSKMSLLVFIIIQRMLGPFRMWTSVDFNEGERFVRHSTKMSKWGITIYRSEKIFSLLEDGYSLHIEGVEYFWPFNFLAVPFKPKRGVVDPSTKRASYKMPMAGTDCDCQTFLDQPSGYIEVIAPGLRGKFSLTAGSQEILAQRLEEGRFAID